MTVTPYTEDNLYLLPIRAGKITNLPPRLFCELPTLDIYFEKNIYLMSSLIGLLI